MAITYVASGGMGGSPLTLPTYAENDLLLFIGYGYDAYVSLPSGYTNIDTNSNTKAFMRVAYKIASASESQPTFTYGGSVRSAGRVVSFRGTDLTSPINGKSLSTESGTTYIATNPTTTVDGCMIVNCICFYDTTSGDASNYTSWANTDLASITEACDNNLDSGGGSTVAYGIDTTAGAIKDTTATADNSGNSSATIVVALQVPQTASTPKGNMFLMFM